MKTLDDYIAPYIRVEERQKGLAVGTVHGTAFFINDQGTFLTARHVVKACERDVLENGGEPAHLMRDDRQPNHYVRGAVTNVDFAAEPYDIAIGTVHRQSKGDFVFGETAKAWMWEDVYAAGYPATATRLEQDSPRTRIDPRGHKGQVLRRVSAGHVLIHPHPTFIEVSFAITKGMSGAPLVMRNQLDADGNLLPYQVLLGVCVGNEPSRIVDFSHIEVVDGSKEFRETTARIEEYGIVHDIRPLADWAPTCLGGLTLKEAIQPDAL